MKITTTLIMAALFVCACGQQALRGKRNNESYQEKISSISGRDSISCGTTRSDSDAELNDCIAEAFYDYQPFTATLVSQVPFYFYSVTTYVFDGMQLYKVSQSSIDCAELTPEQCAYYYQADECINPKYIGLEGSTEAYFKWFSCSL